MVTVFLINWHIPTYLVWKLCVNYFPTVCKPRGYIYSILNSICVLSIHVEGYYKIYLQLAGKGELNVGKYFIMCKNYIHIFISDKL